MRENAFGGADEVVAVPSMSSEGDREGGGVDESALLSDGGPADDTGTPQMKEEEEALDTAAFAQLGPRPGRRETGPSQQPGANL